ncbi:hypothetical protein BOX15_Mlig020059g1, partial [Macrostomum lignano]
LPTTMSGPMSSLNKSRRMPFKPPSNPNFGGANNNINTTHSNSSRSSSRQSSDLTTGTGGGGSKRSSPRLPPMSSLSTIDDKSLGSPKSAKTAEDDSELLKLANEVLDDEVSRRMRRDRQKRETATVKSADRPPSARGNSDADLLATAVSRVGALERLCKEQREELSRRQRRIDVLEDKVRLLTTAAGAAKGSSREVDSLRSRCRELQKQVHEMENFLADYGLIWVGEDDADEAADWNWDPSSFWRPKDSTSTDAAADSIEATPNFFNRLLECIRELNRLVGEDELQVTKTGTGAKLARQKLESAIPLSVYANGLALWDGPFRLYTEPSTRQLVADILDGYFPTELQSRYPDGVAFVVNDRREVQFDSTSSNSTLGFAGQGRVLGGGSRDDQQQQQRRQQFLGRLPASVVAKSGQLVDVRQSVADTLSAGHEQQLPARQLSNVLIDASGDTPADRVASVKIRCNVRQANAGTYLIRLPFNSKVSQLFSLLRDRGAMSNLNIANGEQVALVNAYPRSTLSEDGESTATVEECGLAPNATLMLVVQKINK